MSLSNSWGYKMKNGSYDGVVAATQSGTIDFPSAPLAFQKDRFSVVSYGRHTWLLK